MNGFLKDQEHIIQMLQLKLLKLLMQL